MAITINLTDALEEDKVMVKEWANSEGDTHAQAISGVKTFSTSPLVPTPTVPSGAVPKEYVDLHNSNEKWVYTEVAISSQTIFTADNDVVGASVYSEGALLTLDTHYTESGDTITLLTPATTGDIITIVGGITYDSAYNAMAIGNINNPLLDLPLNNSLAIKQGIGSVTFERASTATYVDRYGVVQSAAIDEARFEKEGFLLEGASTNECAYSQDFSNWLEYNAATTSTFTEIAPDGTSTAGKAVATADAQTSGFYQNISVNQASGTYTYSYFVNKNVTASNVRLLVRDTANSANYVSVNVDTATWTAGSTFTLGTYSDGQPARIEKVGDWYRISITFTIGADVNIRTYAYATSLATGEEVTVWGAQIEELPFATSYIPTTTTAVTRNQEICEVENYNNMPNTNTADTDLAIAVDFRVFGGTGASQFIVGQYANYQNNWYIRNYSLDARVGCYTESGGVTASLISPYYEDRLFGTFKRVILNVKGSLQELYFDGILEDSTARATTNMTDDLSSTKLNIGAVSTSLKTYGHIKNVRVWNSSLTTIEASLA